MSKILLIHGYGSAIKYSFFKSYDERTLAFSGYSTELRNGDAKLFKWYIAQQWSLLQVINPFAHLRIYRQERNKANSKQVLTQLDQVLQTEKPKIIICHSLGSYLLHNYLQQFPLPANIKQIVLIQADISRETKFTNLEVPIFNLYCPWDPSLITSAVINGYIPAGLSGLKSATRNVLTPLYKNINLHISTIGDPNTNNLISSFEKDP